MKELPLAHRTQQIKPSATLAITTKAKQLKEAGLDIINFGAGEPDFDTPENIKEAAISAIKNGFTKYTPASGIAALKEAISDKLARDNQLHYSTTEIIVSCGAKHSLFNIALSLFEPGSQVVIIAPYWVSYIEQVRLAGAEPLIVTTKEEKGFQLNVADIARVITPRTKAIIVNSPTNPSGVVLETENLAQLASLVVTKGLYLIADECYEKLIYDGKKHISIASLGEEIRARTLVVNAVSKSYAMTGWRIGYTAGPAEVIQAMGRIQSQTTSNPCSISQRAALAALRGSQETVTEMVAAFDQRRRYLVTHLNAIAGFSCTLPAGAFYAFPNCSQLLGRKTPSGETISSPTKLAEYLLTEGNVAVIPGEPFGSNNHLRLSYATSLENIKNGVARIEKAVAQLQD